MVQGIHTIMSYTRWYRSRNTLQCHLCRGYVHPDWSLARAGVCTFGRSPIDIFGEGLQLDRIRQNEVQITLSGIYVDLDRVLQIWSNVKGLDFLNALR